MLCLPTCFLEEPWPWHLDLHLSPGAFQNQMAQRIDLRVHQSVPKNNGMIKVVNTVPMDLPGPFAVVASLDGSIGKSDYVYKNGIDATSSSRRGSLYVKGMYNGRLYDKNMYPTLDELKTYIELDPTLDWYRQATAKVALDELKMGDGLPDGFCGEDAEDKYGGSSRGWCSEFVAWVYAHAGMEGKTDVDDVDNVDDMIDLFEDYSDFKKAKNQEITPLYRQHGRLFGDTGRGRGCLWAFSDDPRGHRRQKVRLHGGRKCGRLPSLRQTGILHRRRFGSGNQRHRSAQLGSIWEYCDKSILA